MKQVKNLSIANTKYSNFVRREDLDFEDDGSYFRGYSYKNILPITTLYSDGRVYCSVRPDYINYGGIPWEIWKETEEYHLCDKYNGTSDLIDLDDLDKICERTLAKIDELKNNFEKMELDPAPVLRKLKLEYAEIDSIFTWFKTINWFDKNLSDYEIHNIKYHYNGLKNDLKFINETEEKIILKTIDKAKLFELIDRVQKNPDNHLTSIQYHSDDLKELAAKEDK